MNKKLFVGNLAWEVTEVDLNALFQEAGRVVMATVIIDRNTGRSRGFGFVEMSTPEEAHQAIDLFNGKYIKGRAINVREANPENKKEDRTDHSSYTTQINEFIHNAEPGEEITFSVNFRNFLLTRER